MKRSFGLAVETVVKNEQIVYKTQLAFVIELPLLREVACCGRETCESVVGSDSIAFATKPHAVCSPTVHNGLGRDVPKLLAVQIADLLSELEDLPPTELVKLGAALSTKCDAEDPPDRLRRVEVEVKATHLAPP